MSDHTADSDPELPPPLQGAVDALDGWCRSHLGEEEARDRVQRPLYHYTSAAGLKGIFETRQMWFTDYRHLNDPTELRLGVDRAHEALRAAGEGADGRVGLFLRMAADLFSQENVDTLGFFVASFSRARNDLGQWRAYADNGRGFAIGYAPRMFEVRPDLSAAPEENAFLGPVVYDADEAVSRHRLAIDQAAAIFRATANANAALLRDGAVGIPFMRIFALRLIASALIWNALTTKHPAYEREEEVRMIIMGTAAALLPVTKTRTRGSEIVPYIAHPWALRGPEDIAEIVVGPAAPPDAERPLQTLLATCGLAGVTVVRSDIPYRAL
jgi:hypothetical protein